MSLKNLHPVIPLDIVQEYYTQEIVFCGFLSNQLHIMVKIPFSSVAWSVPELIPLPYRWQNHICELLPEPLYQFKSNHESLFLPKSDHPSCVKGSLCFLPRVRPSYENLTLCLEAIHSNAFIETTKNHCYFHCSNTVNTKIFQIHSGKFCYSL